MEKMGMVVLVVDDETSIRTLVRVNLESRGYRVIEADNGLTAIQALEREMPDLIVLDLMMPHMDGTQVCEWVRERSLTPIIVLSALSDEAMMIRALDAGADDYVIKPFRLEVFLARVRALQRRVTTAPPTNADDDRVSFGDLAVYLKAKRVTLSGREVKLTRTEFALLAELAKNPNSVLTHDELLARVWGEEYRGSSHYLYVYFNRIRKKIGDETNRILEAVPGFGYVMHLPPTGDSVSPA
jgi:two-component system, OmpR family, KDP operon response regulator KdpE